MLYLLVLLIPLAPAPARADQACSAPPRPHAPDRRADFYRIRRHAEERERARDDGRRDLEGRFKEHDRKIEAGRLEYIRTRRPPPDNAAGEEQWQAGLKERARKIEEARKCFVTQRAHAAANPGSDVPGDVEYGLDE